MKKKLLLLFTWWNGSTWGTAFHTWRKGDLVGEDEFGNIYYEGRDGRRWVQYDGVVEASAIPPGWHGWMHYRTDVSPADEQYRPREWQKPHKVNQTGEPGAYFPKGSMVNGLSRPRVTGDYEAWSP